MIRAEILRIDAGTATYLLFILSTVSALIGYAGKLEAVNLIKQVLS